MFSTLRQGSPLYILDKGSEPNLQIGTVQNIISPAFTPYSNSLDITVKVGNDLLDFKQLPTALSIANYNNGNTIVSDSREYMSTEVENMIKASKEIIESIPYHEKVIENSEEILKQLSPQYAKQKDQEDKINNLETKVGSMESKLDDIASMLSKALNK